MGLLTIRSGWAELCSILKESDIAALADYVRSLYEAPNL